MQKTSLAIHRAQLVIQTSFQCYVAQKNKRQFDYLTKATAFLGATQLALGYRLFYSLDAQDAKNIIGYPQGATSNIDRFPVLCSTKNKEQFGYLTKATAFLGATQLVLGYHLFYSLDAQDAKRCHWLSRGITSKIDKFPVLPMQHKK